MLCCFVRYYNLYRFYKYCLLEIIFFKCLGDIVYSIFIFFSFKI